MATTWKKILVEGDEDNIGSSDLTITAGATRTLSFGDASSKFRVKNNNNKLLLVLHETTARLGSNISTATLELQTSGSTLTMASDNTVLFDKTNRLTIESDDSSTGTPVLELFKNEASPVDDQVIGTIEFNGEDSASQKTLYGSISVETDDVTHTTEDGTMKFTVYDQGSSKTWLTAKNPSMNASFTSDALILSTTTEPESSNAKPILVLRNTSNSVVNNDVIGAVRFDARNTSSQNTPLAEIEGVVSETTDNDEVGRLNFFVKNADVALPQEVLALKGTGGAEASITETSEKTVNEQKLDALDVRGTSLENLTQRTMYQFDFTDGYATGPNTVDGTNTVYPDLGHNSIGARLGAGLYASNDDGDTIFIYDYSDSYGFVVPFDSYLTGCTVAYQRNTNVTSEGHIAVHAIVVKEDPQETATAHLMTSAANNVNNTDDYRVSIYHLPEASQRSIKVEAGDKIVPRITITKGADGDGTYHYYNVVDVLGHFYLYAESMGL